eukprot:CAMPEP_0170404130 /NCGR_PEP_ID=MMETSP0117_2-20130122/26467_1 /TAXON_ID=400756 /ORGANISM="Durinskia baltica, Strain CSIRO CS-38" /LENGTH=142 /DNA_ID=CAMNT_0010661125 /DNA_START=200 /DNA_END=624 /DNA_ORIENTATION=-
MEQLIGQLLQVPELRAEPGDGFLELAILPLELVDASNLFSQGFDPFAMLLERLPQLRRFVSDGIVGQQWLGEGFPGTLLDAALLVLLRLLDLSLFLGFDHHDVRHDVPVPCRHHSAGEAHGKQQLRPLRRQDLHRLCDLGDR